MIAILRNLFSCRRTTVAMLSNALITVVGVLCHAPEVTGALALVSVGLSAANAYEKSANAAKYSE